MSEKICFVIAPIGEADSDTRRRSDQILKHVITPAAEACGYKPVRADGLSDPGMITSQVIQHIVDDPLVIADLTDRNPNVFYELALRHALKKPIVQIIQKGQQIPFDVAGSRTIQVDHKDLDSVEASKEEIKRQIESLEKNPDKLETPISMSMDLKALQASNKPQERSMADILGILNELKAGMFRRQAVEEELNKTREYMRLVLGERASLKRAVDQFQKYDAVFEAIASAAGGVYALIRKLSTLGLSETEKGADFQRLKEEANRLRELVTALPKRDGPIFTLNFDALLEKAIEPPGNETPGTSQ